MMGLMRIIVLLSIFYFIYRLFKGFFLNNATKTGNKPLNETLTKGEDLVEDQHCHRYLPLSQALRTDIDGNEVFFCSQECYDQYKKDKNLTK
jgi:uncharacterized protein